MLVAVHYLHYHYHSTIVILMLTSVATSAAITNRSDVTRVLLILVLLHGGRSTSGSLFGSLFSDRPQKMFFARPEAILAAQFGLAVVPGQDLGFKV